MTEVDREFILLGVEQTLATYGAARKFSSSEVVELVERQINSYMATALEIDEARQRRKKLGIGAEIL